MWSVKECGGNRVLSVKGVWWKQGVVSEGSVVETGCGQ